VIGIREENHRCFKKQRHEDLLIILLCYRWMQMVKWPSAFSISTDFYIFSYQKKRKDVNKVEKEKDCRKRKITISLIDSIIMKKKLLYAGLLQNVLAESESTNAGGFFMRKLLYFIEIVISERKFFGTIIPPGLSAEWGLQ